MNLLPARYLTAQYCYGRATVSTSHGCPDRCNFCALWKAAGGKYHKRPLNVIVEDIAATRQRRVFLADDNTFADPLRAELLAALIKDAGIRKEYQGYARTDTIVKYPDLFRFWRDIGLRELVVGIEAADEGGLKRTGKHNCFSNAGKAVRILNNFDITCWGHFICYPDFTVAEYRRVTAFCDEIGLRTPFFLPLTPLPGTDLYAEMKGEIVVTDLDYYNFEYPVCRLSLPLRIVREETARLWRRMYSAPRYLRMARRGELPWRRLLWHLLVAAHMRRCVRKVLKKWEDLEER